jgi:ligand-binding SRPBCC domain-containing protein
MTQIRLTTLIQAPIERCFDLSRSIDLHMLSTQDTGERAVAGRVAGLVEKGDSVTWEAKHFGIKQQLTTAIEEVLFPTYFNDRMVKGAFKSMYHEHFFENKDGGTLMTDIFCYETPFGFAGQLFDSLILKKYMAGFLLKRNEVIKNAAEGSGWEEILKQRNI